MADAIIMDDDNSVEEASSEEEEEEEEEEQKTNGSRVVYKGGGSAAPTVGGADPLRPRREVQHESEEMDDLPTHVFEMTTSDVDSFSSLMYAMRDLVGDLRLYADSGGITLSEQVTNNSVFIYLRMKEEVFEHYECGGKVVLCFQPERMYKYISRHTTDSLMTWKLIKEPTRRTKEQNAEMPARNRDVHYYLRVTIVGTGRDQRTASSFVYYVPLLRSYKQIWKARKTPVSYLLNIDTTTMKDILGTFKELQGEVASKYLEIECTDSYVKFQMHGNGTVNHASITKVIKRDADPDKPMRRIRRSRKDQDQSKIEEDCIRDHEEPGMIRASYCLIYLLRLQKCFAINRDDIFMYICKDYPLLFKSRLGIGDLMVAVMFVKKTDMDDESYEQQAMPENAMPMI